MFTMCKCQFSKMYYLIVNNILEFFSFNGYVLDFGLEGGVPCLGLGLEVCVLGLALALGVMSSLTSLEDGTS